MPCHQAMRTRMHAHSPTHLTLPWSSSTMPTTFANCIWLTACPRCDEASTASVLTSPRSRIRLACTSLRRS